MKKLKLHKSFVKERDELLSGEKKIPSYWFIKQFMNNLPDEGVVPQEFSGRDAEDYYSWGYALFGFWTDGEMACYQLKLFQWVDLYASIKRDDMPAFEEAVFALLNLEEKLLGITEEDKNKEEVENPEQVIMEVTLPVECGFFKHNTTGEDWGEFLSELEGGEPETLSEIFDDSIEPYELHDHYLESIKKGEAKIKIIKK